MKTLFPSGRSVLLRSVIMPSLIAGALAALTFPPLHLVPLLLLAFPLWLRAIRRSATWAEAGLSGFAFGFALHTLGLYWLTNAILIRAAEFWWLVPFASPACALILGPFAAVPAILCRLAPDGWRRGVLLAGLWTVCDMSRLYLFSGFPWNPLGSDWAFHGLPGDVMIQPAAWIGVDGLTLLTVLLACLMPLGLRQFLAGGAVLLLWVLFGVWRLTVTAHPLAVAQQPVVVLVQGNVSESEKIDRSDIREIFGRYMNLTLEGVQQGVRLAQENAGSSGSVAPVVYLWPETAFPGVLDREAVARDMIARAATGATAGIIGTLRRAEDDHWRNSLAVIDDRGRVEGEYDKARLVPFGEYQPAFIPVQVVPGGGMTPGPGPRTLHIPGVSAFGPLICYEVIFSGHMTDPKDRPSWLANITNDAWYGNSAGPRQHLAAVRLRTVEEGLPIARAANTGVSIVYDARGHEEGRLEWGKEGVLVRQLPPALPPTIFARYGQEIPLSLSLLCVVLGLTWRFGTRTEHMKAG